MSKLSEVQIALHLKNLPQWQVEKDQLIKTYTFNTFMDAISFVNQTAKLAEEANHHPDLFIQYRKIQVFLSTHDEGGITGKDFLLAEQLDSIHKKM